jgi:hypothetical protein
LRRGARCGAKHRGNNNSSARDLKHRAASTEVAPA